MNLFASPLSFSKNPQPCGLFSSQTAFRKPNVPPTFFTSSDKNHSLPAFIHPKDLVNKQPNKPVKILHKIEDQDLILCEPVKKVKQDRPEPFFFDKANMNKPQQNICKTSRLTIEDVFETPVMPTLTKKIDLTEECFNDDDDDASSLSFISSCSSSLDDLDDDDVILVSRRQSSDCMIIEPVKEQKHGGNMQELVVKDDILGRLSYTNQENLVVKNSEIYPLVEPNLKELAFGAPLCIPPNNVNRFFDFNKYSQRIMRLSLNFSDKTSNDLIENSKNLAVDGYDSDSSATKSTSIEQEASQKGASPAYGPIPGSYNEENYKQNRLKAHLNNEQKKEKLINRGRKPRDKANIKDKKKSLMNLKLDLNPKQLKVERRLNRLQLLRYQQGVIEDEDEEIKKFGISDLLSRANSSVPESSEIQINHNGMSKINDNEAHLAFDQFILEDSQAVIPPLEETRGVRRRVVQQVWDPETVEEQHIEEYLWKLSEILEIPVNNIEAALKLLNSFNKNICDTLKTVEENKVFYFELFRLKVRRQRRRGA